MTVTGPALLAAALAAASPPDGSGFDLKSLDPVRPSASAGPCEGASPDEVVVCKKRERGYRLDPAILAATRARNAHPAAGDKAAALANANPCNSGIGPQGCTGQPTVDFVAIALVAAKVAAAAAQGEDWRKTLRTGPDEYEEYKAAKEREEARKPRVSVSLGAGSRPARQQP